MSVCVSGSTVTAGSGSGSSRWCCLTSSLNYRIRSGQHNGQSCLDQGHSSATLDVAKALILTRFHKTNLSLYLQLVCLALFPVVQKLPVRSLPEGFLNGHSSTHSLVNISLVIVFVLMDSYMAVISTTSSDDCWLTYTVLNN